MWFVQDLTYRNEGMLRNLHDGTEEEMNPTEADAYWREKAAFTGWYAMNATGLCAPLFWEGTQCYFLFTAPAPVWFMDLPRVSCPFIIQNYGVRGHYPLELCS